MFHQKGIIESICQQFNEIDSHYKERLIELLDNMKNEETECNAKLNNGLDVCDTDDDDFQEEPLFNDDINDDNGSMHESATSKLSNDEMTNDQQQNNIHLLCNHIKIEIRELREQCVKALNISRLFMNDLELAAKYEIKSEYLNKMLKTMLEKNYVLCNLIETSATSTTEAPSSSGAQTINATSFMIFVPSELANDKKQILRLLYMTSSKDDILKTG